MNLAIAFTLKEGVLYAVGFSPERNPVRPGRIMAT
jgi:hypothetical protein